jgi:hypothetical protein
VATVFSKDFLAQITKRGHLISKFPRIDDQGYNLKGTHPDDGVRTSLQNDNVYLQAHTASRPIQ